MHVSEVRFPGMLISSGDAEWAQYAHRGCEAIVASLDDATIALALFDESSASQRLPTAFEKELPRVYGVRVSGMHARSFVFAIDRIEKILSRLIADGQLAERDHRAPAGLAAGLARAHDRLLAAVPRIRDLGHALAHAGPSDIQTVQGAGFGTLLSDGTHAKVDITSVTLEGVRASVQLAIDAFEWEGPGHVHPYGRAVPSITPP